MTPHKLFAIFGSLLFAVSLFACEDNNTQRGCASNTDCRMDRVCEQGTCTTPTNPSPDMGVEDAVQDIAQEQRDLSPEQSDLTIAPEDLTTVDDVPILAPPPTSICGDAITHVGACSEQFIDPIEEQIFEWMGSCNPLEACVAECILKFECGTLACEFDDAIDCDGSPLLQCIQDECSDIPEPNTCQTDSDCVLVTDCCAQTQTCHQRDEIPVTCDIDCDPQEGPSGCFCAQGVCQESFDK